MLKQLRIKLVCILMAVIIIMLAVIFGLVLHFTQQNLEQNSIQMMRDSSKKNGPNDHPNGRSDDVRLPFFTVELGADGDIIAANGSYYDLTDKEFLQEITDCVLSSGEQTGILTAYSLRFLYVADEMHQRIVFADISSELSTMSNLWKICILTGVLSIIAFLFISVFFARWAVKPVAKAWEQQNQFVADASHELKTPLTVILTNAELLQSTDYNEESKAQSAVSILTMARQMRSLVSGLLDLARADNGAAKTSMTRLNFSELVSDILLPFEPMYYEKELSLTSEIESGITLVGSELHLRQVLEILLDNALKYSFSHSEVTVRLSRHGQHCLLSVSNFGETISPADTKRIFDRFYRMDKARGNTGSYGLGLAIADSIVREHNGKIWAESRDGINTFCIQLPI